MNEVVLGVDVGTTATKVAVVPSDGAVLIQVERSCELRAGEAGEAVQDAERVREAAMAAAREAAEWAATHGHRVAALAFSAAMHTLLGMDPDGAPATPAFTWADSRASEVAGRLRAEPDSMALHQATGTPVHTQSVMVKLAWLSEEWPELRGRVARWCGLKDFVLASFVGELVTDYSFASGSGLVNGETLRWHEPALRVAGTAEEYLPGLRAPTTTLPLVLDAAEAMGIPAGTPVVLGGGDGPLANLGVGAVRPGVAALSLGTSGALRVVQDRPGVDSRCRTFSYALADGLWVLGGSVSNGAVVGQWAAEHFGTELADLLDEAHEIPAGARGLLALPYLFGERAPWWESGLTGAVVGLRHSHGAAEITRALAEGVAQQLALVAEAISDTGAIMNTIRATGGGFRSPLWTELLAAALHTELELVEGSSGLGAALLGWHALGAYDHLADTGTLIHPTSTVPPDPDTAEALDNRRALTERLHQTLLNLS